MSGATAPGVAGSDGSDLPVLVCWPDPRHGVAVASRLIADEVGRRVPGILRAVHLPDGLIEGGAHPSRAHVHFTDRLWGPSPEVAAERLEALAARTALAVTLHDIPQPSDGERNLRRRSDAYSRVVAAARGVVVNSRHEVALLDEAGIDAVGPSGPPRVIPLAIDVHAGSVDPNRFDGSVAVLGFFYPGKGHDEVVDAVAVAVGVDSVGDRDESGGSSRSVVSLGGVSPGHEGELAALVASARSRGVQLAASGYLEDDEMIARCRAASVPVVAHRHFSASGSLGTWISAGRRPLVVESRYAREMSELRPGTVTVVPDDGLASAIAAALADPASTVLPADAVTAPHLGDVADSYLDWWRGGVAW